MSAELRELMVYQCPPELGSLYTEVEELMKEMGKEQSVLIRQHMEREERDRIRRQRRRREMNEQALMGASIFIGIILVFYLFAVIIQDRIERYPDLGNCIAPKGSYVYKKWTETIWSECK